MNPQFKTEQEAFWAGEFGHGYSDRNRGDKLLASNTAFFTPIVRATTGVRSVIEFGANIGMNLLALKRLVPDLEMGAVEINAQAVAELRKLEGVQVHHQSILEFTPAKKFDLALIKGVLIHINPSELPGVYGLLHASSRRYICVAEYYNPTPVTVPYRGHTDRLFKRDFAGEMLDQFKDLRLVDYGFVYRRDPHFPQDDISWFLMEKTGRAE